MDVKTKKKRLEKKPCHDDGAASGGGEDADDDANSSQPKNRPHPTLGWRWRPESFRILVPARPLSSREEDEGEKTPITEEEEEEPGFDIMPYVGCDPRQKEKGPVVTNWQERKKIWMPENLPPPDDIKELYKLVKTAGASAGSPVAAKGYQKRESKATFVCYRGVVYKDMRRKKLHNLPSTEKPTSPDECCKFKFYLFWDEDEERWYMKDGIGCPYHSFHQPGQKLKQKKRCFNDATMEVVGGNADNDVDRAGRLHPPPPPPPTRSPAAAAAAAAASSNGEIFREDIRSQTQSLLDEMFEIAETHPRAEDAMRKGLWEQLQVMREIASEAEAMRYHNTTL